MALGKHESRLWRLATWILVLAFTVVLTACPRPLMPPIGPGSAGSPAVTADRGQITGTVDFTDRRLMQTDINKDVLSGSAISLIEFESGNTLSTARADAQGNFILYYSNDFTPQVGKLYYLEAVKGLDAGTGLPNAVGADAVRVRTIISYRNGGWVSLTSSRVGFHIPVTPMTTALSIVVSLRSTAPKNRQIDPQTLFGAIRLGQATQGYPDSLALPDTNLVPEEMVLRTYDLVIDAFTKNRDPLRWVTLAEASFDPNYNTVILPDAPFSIVALSPSEQVPLGEIRLIGTNFAPNAEDNEVYFQTIDGTASATVLEVSPDLASLRVQVPAAAVNGPVILAIGQGEERKELMGPPFRIATTDGHSVVDAAGRVYVVNEGMGTVAVIEKQPNTDATGIRTLISGLDKPQALSFGTQGYKYLYVALGGNAKKVVRYDLTDIDPISKEPRGSDYTHGTGVANPSGMAFRVETGDLYITDSVANKLYVVTAPPSPSMTSPVSEVTLNTVLSEPRGLSFGPDPASVTGTDRRLYIANAAANNVLKVQLTSATTGTATVFVSGLSRPWGLTFDSLGGFYVSNNKGNSIFSMQVSSPPGVLPRVYNPLTSFASIPSPGGIDADSSGYLYVADNTSNGVYQINPNAESKQIGFGVSSPIATWADSKGLYILTVGGRILHLDNSNVLSVYAEGLTNSRGLVRDSKGNFYTINTSLSSLVLVRDSDRASFHIMQGFGDYYPELTIRDDVLYLRRKSSTVSNVAQVEGFPLNLDASGMPNMRTVMLPHYDSLRDYTLQSHLRRAIAVAQNRAAGTPYYKSYYVLQSNQNSEQAVYRVTQGPSTAYYDAVRVIVDPARMKNPADIVVDANGNIWVADLEGFDGNGSLLIYDANGNFKAEITDVENPQRLNYFNNAIAVSCHVTNGYVRLYKASLTDTDFNEPIVPIQTISGIDKPMGVGYSNTAPHSKALFVHSWGTGWVYRFQNYPDLDSGSVAPILGSNQYYKLSNNNKDIEVSGTDLYYSTGSSINRVLSDRTTIALYRSDYQNVERLALDVDNSVFRITSGSMLHFGHNGSHAAGAAPLRATTGSGMGSGVLLQGPDGRLSFVSYGYQGYGASAFIVDTELEPLQPSDGGLYRTKSQRSYSNKYIGAVATNGVDTVYFSHVEAGSIWEWKKNPTTGLGELKDLVGTGKDLQGQNLTGYDKILGLAYYNGFLYQPIRERHFIRRINVTTKENGPMLIGVVSPEL